MAVEGRLTEPVCADERLPDAELLDTEDAGRLVETPETVLREDDAILLEDALEPAATLLEAEVRLTECAPLRDMALLLTMVEAPRLPTEPPIATFLGI